MLRICGLSDESIEVSDDTFDDEHARIRFDVVTQRDVLTLPWGDELDESAV